MYISIVDSMCDNIGIFMGNLFLMVDWDKYLVGVFSCCIMVGFYWEGMSKMWWV